MRLSRAPDNFIVAPWLVGARTPAGRYVQTDCAKRRRGLVPKERTYIAGVMEQVNPSMTERTDLQLKQCRHRLEYGFADQESGVFTQTRM
jgi:hypothetical protein